MRSEGASPQTKGSAPSPIHTRVSERRAAAMSRGSVWIGAPGGAEPTAAERGGERGAAPGTATRGSQRRAACSPSAFSERRDCLGVFLFVCFPENPGGSVQLTLYILIITIISVFPAFARTQDAASGRPQRADGSHKSQRGERAERRSANCEAKENARKGTSGARRRPACVVHLFLVRGRAGRSLFPANGFRRFPSEGAAP